MGIEKKGDPRILSLFSGGELFVDLGCGSGYILDQMVEQYQSCLGLDFSDVRLSMRQTKTTQWQYRQANLNGRFPLDDATVDGVLANQVIEHIDDPKHFSAEIFRVLRAGGEAVVTTPNIRYIKHLYRLIIRGYGPQTAGGNTLDGDWDDGHIHYFTHRDLHQLFNAQGFSFVKSRALIDINNGNSIRRLLDKYGDNSCVREFLSGNILIHLVK